MVCIKITPRSHKSFNILRSLCPPPFIRLGFSVLSISVQIVKSLQHQEGLVKSFSFWFCTKEKWNKAMCVVVNRVQNGWLWHQTGRLDAQGLTWEWRSCFQTGLGKGQDGENSSHPQINVSGIKNDGESSLLKGWTSPVFPRFVSKVTRSWFSINGSEVVLEASENSWRRCSSFTSWFATCPQFKWPRGWQTLCACRVCELGIHNKMGYSFVVGNIW